jgi:uncharacterized protein (TIGR02001 family)
MKIQFRWLPLALSAAASLSGGIGSQALAQDVVEARANDFKVNSYLAVVSDYRFRGWSLSDEAPAVQLDVAAEHTSGVYAGIFVSSIEDYAGEGDNDRATVELDLYAGWSFRVSDWQMDIGAMAYFYPGAEGLDYLALPMTLSRSIGDLLVTAGFEHTPAQDALGGETSDYVWLEAEWSPQSIPVAFQSVIGHEDGAMAPDGKVDWSVAATLPVAGFEIGLSYVDSDERAAGSALVAELRTHF